MKKIALILARGGSKGIPNKNLQLLGGVPLIGYAINSAKYSEVDEVWVSTDSTYIKTISKSLGAKVIDRPDKFATDTSPSEEALLHFAENIDFDLLIFIQPTSPLLKPSHINEGIMMMENYDSVLSAYKEHWLPRWTLNSVPYNFENNKRSRRQDHDELFVENGAFYITTKNNLLNSKLRVSGAIGIYEMPLEDSFQIDTWDDLKMVEKFV